jgi:hypothetical protein
MLLMDLQMGGRADKEACDRSWVDLRASRRCSYPVVVPFLLDYPKEIPDNEGVEMMEKCCDGAGDGVYKSVNLGKSFRMSSGQAASYIRRLAGVLIASGAPATQHQ